ncbi:MAG TPA: DUF3990 domain-containing protein [Candidatus Bacteroides intestinavium]|uniref:DUF3990 domain-containing protein n=1 Tax=Candidatus Bacteroides intestinavium TaxID=2838469 RepID=A0A9D2HRT7_9BACE|nr:DUF3990 domain-containing protein [Candidatus Bacteroides intestinavium]
MPMKIYHGSSVEVPVPQIKVTGFYKDFGFGFYCTQLEKQARRWAVTKRTRHIVNVYEYRADESLRVKCFETMTEEWLDFIVACRKGISHDYDIVEGPMADDAIWDYVEDLMSGRITREAFWVLAKFKYPTHQIVFCTENALHTLTYLDHYAL